MRCISSASGTLFPVGSGCMAPSARRSRSPSRRRHGSQTARGLSTLGNRAPGRGLAAAALEVDTHGATPPSSPRGRRAAAPRGGRSVQTTWRRLGDGFGSLYSRSSWRLPALLLGTTLALFLPLYLLRGPR